MDSVVLIPKHKKADVNPRVMLDLIVDTDYTDETTTIGGLCQR